MAPVLKEHCSGWAAAFSRERDAIERALAPGPCELHHIGSTAVPGLIAKPVIDILLVVPAIGALNDTAVTALGYVARGEYGIPGRRYFVRRTGEALDVHLHAFAQGDRHVRHHLAFRDLLRRSETSRARYAAAKRAALQRSGGDKATYQSLKSPVVIELLAEALQSPLPG
ncbi:GrpB family protein [Aurantiacibacter arachoides]|uniref:GrpB family protein n=1 Tax=Aurantiacibacter arachoides TaxID=1850444 RepID=UPI0018F8B8BE|nr:GrpB family protein [Aurantiacibacter arachoides]GGD49125.1 hypothetical protein GCM10011411_06110 [Aurantiacibacter arachoides]